MIMTLKEHLSTQLKHPLPGLKAHLTMSPHVNETKSVTMQPKTDQPPINSAVLILFYPNAQGDICFPLIQRPDYKGVHSGQISFPGGKAEQYDANLAETALREAREEIGIDESNLEIIGQLSSIYIWVSNFIVYPILAITNTTPIFKADPTEVKEILETKLEDILNPEKIKQTRIKHVSGMSIDAPYFDVHDRIVWGATAMMLGEVREIINKTEWYGRGE